MGFSLYELEMLAKMTHGKLVGEDKKNSQSANSNERGAKRRRADWVQPSPSMAHVASGWRK